MKRYELIQTFPGSPKIGCIAIYRDGHNDYVTNSDRHGPYPAGLIEQYPKFWKSLPSVPFFTTEDGEDVFDENTFLYYIGLLNSKDINHIFSDRASYLKEHKLNGFMHKKNAEAYVAPIFSKKQILDAIDKANWFSCNSGKVVVIDSLKQKLGL